LRETGLWVGGKRGGGWGKKKNRTQNKIRVKGKEKKKSEKGLGCRGWAQNSIVVGKLTSHIRKRKSEGKCKKKVRNKKNLLTGCIL